MALAKRCKRLGIPVPGRGYWARVDAGQTPYRPKFPKREPEWHDQSALTVSPSTGADKWKVSQDYTQQPKTDWYYGERSVFEVARFASEVEND